MNSRTRINVRGVDLEIWDRMKEIRMEEQICLGRLVTEALEHYSDSYFSHDEMTGETVSDK